VCGEIQTGNEYARGVHCLWGVWELSYGNRVADSFCVIDEGLRERRPAMCQIPTYITRVAGGREKVGIIIDMLCRPFCSADT